MMAPEDSDVLCDIISLMYERDWVLKFVFLLQFIMASLSLICVISLALLLCAWKAFSANVRLLMISQLSALAAANVGVLLSCIYHLQAIIFRAGSRCYWFSFTYYDCYVIRLIFNVSISATYASALAMAMDRITSSLLEPSPRVRKCIAVFLILSQVTNFILLLLLMIKF
jgi:hypothetical protein